jgi:pimeloyl-ACP methyl ester carboxylesterase
MVQRIRGVVPRFEPGSCPFDVPEGIAFRCGFVVVPEDHSDPDGPTIRLAVAVVEDLSPEREPDPVIVLSGGPGGKTVEDAGDMAFVFEAVHPHRDLVLFDQRGVGLSQPALECPELEQSFLDLLDDADVEVVLRTEFEAAMACRDRLTEQGYNLSAYNTTQDAADVSAIRIALGYDRADLHGASYGSFLAQAVMRDHPEGIRSVLLSSVWPLEKSASVEGSVTVAEAVVALVDDCAHDQGCNAAYPNLKDVLFETIDELNAEPVPLVATNPTDGQSYDVLLSGDQLTDDLIAALYVTEYIPALPLAIYNAHDGDYGLMARLAAWRMSLMGGLSRGMQYSVLCAEDLIGQTPEDLLEAEMSIPRQLRGQADPELVIEYGVFGTCENWPVEKADPSFKEPVVSDIPTLVLEGEFDPVTPPEYGRLVAEKLSNSYFYELPGMGHNVASASECAESIAAAFFDDPTREPDAACVADMPGVAYDLPPEPGAAKVELEVFTDDWHRFTSLAPRGWSEPYPQYYRRGLTALDPTTFMLGAYPMTADRLFGLLSQQLGFDPALQSVGTEWGAFAWHLYEFQFAGDPADLALAEADGEAYYVLLVSLAEERDTLYEALFLRAVRALVPIE